MKKFDPSKATDTQLLDRFECGRDQRAFAELIRRHGPMVIATARRVLRSREDWQDAFQATFFALARATGKLKEKAALAGWLHRTAYRSACEIQRRNVRNHTKVERMKHRIRQSTNDLESTDSNDPSLRLANEELENILDEELSRLPEKLQAAIVLCDLEGMTQKQAAEQLGVAPATVAERVSKARQLLRSRMVKRGVTFTLTGLAACVASSSDSAAALTSSIVSDTAAKATLYAAGKSALEIGVSASVIQTANKVITAMTIAKLTGATLVATAILAFASVIGVASGVATAGTLFVDQFDDGDYADQSPVTWQDFGIGLLDASSGNLVISKGDPGLNPDLDVAADIAAFAQRDISVRLRARVTETGGNAVVTVRNQARDDTRSYFVAVSHLQEFGGSILWAGLSDTGNTLSLFDAQEGELGWVALPYDVREEFTNVQIDVFGDEIKVWGWRDTATEEMPAQPQFHEVDATYPDAGNIRLVSSNRGSQFGSGNSSAIFYDVWVADMPIHQIVIPEPSTATLGSLTLMGLAIFAWRRSN